MGPVSTAPSRVQKILYDPEVGLFAIDLRGTLIHTPRVTALLPELDSCGVPGALAQSVQTRFDAQMRGPLQQRGDILDWTHFAATSMAAMLAAERRPGLDVEAIVAGFRERYLREARRLIEPAPLWRVSRALAGRCAIIADGPRQREAAVLATCFGAPAWMPPLISSECLGVNKLTADFFARLSRRWDVAAAATVVVGDRWDKDVLTPRQAGCRGVLVGPGPEGIHLRPDKIARVDSLTGFADLLEGETLRCAA